MRCGLHGLLVSARPHLIIRVVFSAFISTKRSSAFPGAQARTAAGVRGGGARAQGWSPPLPATAPAPPTPEPRRMRGRRKGPFRPRPRDEGHPDPSRPGACPRSTTRQVTDPTVFLVYFPADSERHLLPASRPAGLSRRFFVALVADTTCGPGVFDPEAPS